jgi:hypothetical protein
MRNLRRGKTVEPQISPHLTQLRPLFVVLGFNTTVVHALLIYR